MLPCSSLAPLIPYPSCTAGFPPFSPKPLGHPAQPSLQPLFPGALAQGGLRSTDPAGNAPTPNREQGDVLTPSCSKAATHHPGTNVTLRHFAHSPHPFTHPRLLHTDKSHPCQQPVRGERSQSVSVCTGSGKRSGTKSLSEAILLRKHKKYNPCLVKKQLPAFTLPHAVQPCTFWQGYKNEEEEQQQRSRKLCHPVSSLAA